jgi:PAS domain S-box-containing protein
MKDERKTKKQLVAELAELSHRLAELEAVEARRRQAVEALPKSEERYRNLFEGVPVGLYRTTPEGRILHANAALIQMLGYPDRRTLMEVNVLDLYVDAEERRCEQAMLEREGIVRGFEMQLRRYDGTAIWVRDTVRAGRDVRGYVVYYEGSLEDITERKQAGEALKKSEAMYRILADNTYDWEFWRSPEGRFIYCSPSCERVTGYAPEAFLKDSSLLGQIVHPDDQARYQNHRTQTSQKPEPGEVEFRVIRPDGTLRWIGHVCQPVFDENGAFMGIRGSNRDITERKRVEEALRFTQFALDRVSLVASWMRVDDGRFVYVNEAACRSSGYSREELLGMTMFDIDPEFSPARWAELNRELRQGGPRTFETTHRARDGRLSPVEVTASVLEIAGEEFHCGFAHDITERKRLEEERERLLAQVREQAQQVQQIIDTVPEGVLLLDADMRVIVANPVAARDLTVLAGAEAGDTLTHLGDRPLAQLLARPPRGFWHEVVAEGSTPRHFEIIAKAVEAGSTVGGWVLVIRDVTREREVEQQALQQERLAAVGQLAGGIAHDFNNLLTTILLYAHLPLGKHDLPPDVTRSLEAILEEAKRAASLVSQILDFSRRSPIKTQPLDLGPLVEETAQMLRRVLPENIRLDVGVDADNHVVDADPTRIQQVVMNLALNARDAMPEGGELRVALSRAGIRPGANPPVLGMPAGEWVCLTVADTGTGLSDEVQSHLFEPFFTTKPPGKGTGLGLAQVHGIVMQHKGHIGVETEAGKGTAFSIYLPAHPGEAEEAAGEIAASPQGRGETILLVEDNAGLREASRRILESLGYRVLAAADGGEALAVCQSAGIDLVITDLVMPEVGGRELVQELRKTRPDLKALAITGYVLQQDVDELRREGFLDVVHKPFDVDAMARMVRRVLDAD